MRDTSLAFKNAINGDQQDDPFLFLIKMSHSSFSDDIRLVNDGQNITHNSEVYLASGFQLMLPNENKQIVQRLRFSILNVDASLTARIRALNSAPTIEAFLVFRSTPDVVEVGPYFMEVHDTRMNKISIDSNLVVSPIGGDPYPGNNMDQTIFTNLK